MVAFRRLLGGGFGAVDVHARLRTIMGTALLCAGGGLHEQIVRLWPIVIAKTTRYDERGNPFVMGPMNGRWALATTKALGLPQAADFMWNFPVRCPRPEEASSSVTQFRSTSQNHSQKNEQLWGSSGISGQSWQNWGQRGVLFFSAGVCLVIWV